MNTDSAYYLSAGERLVAGSGLTAFDGQPLTTYAPGLSAVVAIGEWIGIGSSWTVRLLNSLSAATIVVMSYVLLAGHVRSRVVTLVAVAFVALQAGALELGVLALTELPFQVAVLFFVLLLERAREPNASSRWLVGVVATVWCAFLFRYAALVLIPIGFLVLLTERNRDFRARVVRCAAFVLAASAVPVLWMLRNLSTDGSLLGVRAQAPSGDIGPRSTAEDLLGTLGSWLLPAGSPDRLQRLGRFSVPVLLGAAIVVAALVIALRSWRQMRRGTEGVSEPSPRSLLPCVVFVLLYPGSMWVAQTRTRIDPLDNRLLYPMMVPLVILGAVAIDRNVLSFSRRRSRAAVALLAVACGIVFSLQASVVARETVDAARDGVPSERSEWNETEIVHTAGRLIPQDGVIYSNVPEALWAVLGRGTVYRSPRNQTSDAVLGDSLDAIQRRAGCEPVYLVWFSRMNQRNHVDPSELGGHLDLAPVETVTDGRIYQIRQDRTDQAPCR